MKTQFTPGPYSRTGQSGDNHIMAKVKGISQTVAIISGWGGIPDAEHVANKALFRSAPELFGALEQIAELEGDDENQHLKLTRFQVAQIAREALRKAMP